MSAPSEGARAVEGEGPVQRARRELLTRLLERFERSRMYGRRAPWPRDMILPIDPKEFPGAFAPDGSEEMGDLCRAARSLEAEGALHLTYFKGLPDERPREARLGSAEVETAYAIAAQLGFRPLAESLHALEDASTRIISSSPEMPDWMRAFLARVADGARRADLSALGTSRERFKRDRDVLLDALRAAAALACGVDGWERVVSERVFSDSKRLGVIRGAVRELLLAADPRWSGMDADDTDGLLESYGVRRKPGTVQCAGRAEIRVGERVYLLQDFQPVAHLPDEWAPRWADGIVNSSALLITTIENEFPFLSYVLEAGGPQGLAERKEVVVYAAGFPSKILLQSLVSIATRAPAIGFRHWGDADAGGLRIWWYLRVHLARSVLLFRTDRTWLEAEVSRSREIGPYERKSLEKLAAEIQESPVASEPDVQEALGTVRALLTLGRKVEQERW